MRPSLLPLLADPSTRTPLRLAKVTKEDAHRIWEGELESPATGKTFRILRGIPRFVEGETYSDSFGMQWNRFRTSQLDSQNGSHLSERRFETETRWADDEIEGKWVMDAGCGAGRFAEVAARKGANVVGLDLSSAVDATFETLREHPNADVVQGSLLEPPFLEGAFDFAYCLGVIQHTPDPALGVKKVVSCAKRDGGKFAFAIYARAPWTKLNAKYLVRPLTKRLPPQVLLGALRASMPVVYPVTDRLFRLPVVGRAFRFGIPVANWVEFDGDLSTEQRYEMTVLDTFDMLAPAYDSPMTWQEVERALGEMGASRWTFGKKRPIEVSGVR